MAITELAELSDDEWSATRKATSTLATSKRPPTAARETASYIATERPARLTGVLMLPR